MMLCLLFAKWRRLDKAETGFMWSGSLWTEKQLVRVDSTVDDVIQTQLNILISLSEAQWENTASFTLR